MPSIDRVDRPDAPDPRQLHLAIQRGAESLHLEPEGCLAEVVARVERPRSTIFRVDIRRADETLFVLYYKRSVVALEHGDGTAPRVEVLSERFFSHSIGEGITPAHVLVHDTETRTTITLEVKGRPLQTWLRRPHLRRRTRMPALFRRIGRGIFILEECTEPADVNGSGPLPQPYRPPCEARLDVLATLDVGIDVPALRSKIEQLFDESTRADLRGFAFAHNDLSVTNILVRRGEVAFVDTGWALRPRGWDLGRFHARLLHEPFMRRSMRAEVFGQVLDGYGASDAGPPAGVELGVLTNLVMWSSPPGASTGFSKRTMEHSRAELRALFPPARTRKA